MEYQTQRVKFGLGKANRQKLFDEFARYNTRLKELLDTNDQSTTLKQSRERVKKSLVNKLVWKFWRHAAILHALIDEAWCCQCRHLHRVQLLLHRVTSTEHIEFGIGFLYALTLTSGSLPWIWKSTNAQHIDDVAQDGSLTLNVPQSSALLPSNPSKILKTSMQGPSHQRLPNRAKVTFITSSSFPAQDSNTGLRDSLVIKDLCSSIARCDSSKDSLGLLKGDNESYELKQGHLHQEANDSVTLEELLNGNSDVKLDRRQRYTIAFTLASSHLQLYPSPWLLSHWSKKDIIFFRNTQDRSLILVDQPRLLHDFPSASSTSTSTRFVL